MSVLVCGGAGYIGSHTCAVGYSVLDVLHAYEKACGHELPYVIEARRPGDIAAFLEGTGEMNHYEHSL